jgi:hypothetical protein
LVNDFLNTLNRIQSRVVTRILYAGIKENEIIDDNDYVLRRVDENVVYKRNSVFAVFNEVYAPMRDYGGRTIGFNMHEENVAINNRITHIHVVTLGQGLVILAEGSEQNMNKLLQVLRQLVKDDSFKGLVKDSFKIGRQLYKSKEIELSTVLKGYDWIPVHFRVDIRLSPRDELTS